MCNIYVTNPPSQKQIQVATREYLSFNWGNCNTLNQTSNTALRGYEHATAQGSCNDTFTFSYLVAELRTVCGLTKTNQMISENGTITEGSANSSWVRYRGDLVISYRENVTLPALSITGKQQQARVAERHGRLVTPIDVYILREYAAELTTASGPSASIFVNSPFQLKAAISATAVKPNATTANVKITFGINGPYEISSLSNQYKSDQGVLTTGIPFTSNNGAHDITGAYVLDFTGKPILDASINSTVYPELLTPCSTSHYDLNGFCWRDITVMIVVDSTCMLDHTFALQHITVSCNARYLASDCPLRAPDTTSRAEFTVKTADFCDGQRAHVINGAIVVKAYVPQLTLSRTDPASSTVRSYAVDQSAWLTLFLDTDKSLQVYAMEVIGFQTKLANGIYTTPPDARLYMAGVNEGWLAGPDGSFVAQGFDVATQTHAMWVQLDCNFVVDSSGKCILSPGAEPASSRLDLSARVLFSVDYEADAGAGRRRRQASTERGYASMDTSASVYASDELLAQEAPRSAAPGSLQPAAAAAALMAAAVLSVLG